MISFWLSVVSAISFSATNVEDNINLIAPANPQSACQARARGIIKKAYAPGHDVLRFTASPRFLDKLITCRSQRMFWIRLPNYLHEMVHYSGFKLLGYGPRDIRVRLGHQSAQIGTRRTNKTMHDQAFFLGARSKVVLRGLKLPGRSIVVPLVPKAAWRNSAFGFYLRSGGSAGSGFLSLLDELNAYTTELGLVTALYPRTVPARSRVLSMDNVLALQSMVVLYLKAARTRYPAAHAKMRRNSTLVALTKRFFDAADRALAAATKKRYPNIQPLWPRVRRVVAANRNELVLLAR